jgi:hypothetical protein
MEMPKNCDSCPFWDDIVPYANCTLKHGYIALNPMAEKWRLQDCPLIEVPPHGRLIDVDALQTEAFNRLFIGFARERDVAFVNFLLTDAPTIIQEDKEGEE